MRHCNRRAPPTVLDDAELEHVRRVLAEFHQQGGTRETQHTLDFEQVFLPVREMVRVQSEAVFGPTFGRFCAYTEQEVSEPELSLHRPPRDAMGLDQDVARDHYYWLATEWGNWYPAGKDVARRKGSFFPVHGSRSPVPGPDDEHLPRRDLGLLLEPCHDHPQWWLRAQPDGTWTPASHPSDPRRYGGSPNRGEITIEVLGLNEPWLVKQRRKAVQRAPDLLFSGLGPVGDRERALLADGPYQGFRRQIAAQELLRRAGTGGRVSAEAVRELAPELVPPLLEQADPPPRVLREAADHLRRVAGRIKAGAAGLAALEALLSGEAAPTTPVPGSTSPRTTAATGSATGPATDKAAATTVTIRADAFIAEVEIRNFRCLDHVTIGLGGDMIRAGRQIVLDAHDDEAPAEDAAERAPASAATKMRQVDPLGRPEDQVVPSAAFLGENGSGKSTILQAVAIALAGARIDDLLTDATLTWADLLRRGTDDGEVLITFGRGERVRLTFTATGHAYDGGVPDIQLLVRGFGASRALAVHPAVGERATVEVSNLFNATRPMIDVDGWLAGLDRGSFNVAAATIREFLDLPEEGRLQRDEGHLVVDGTPLRLLSDGYKSVITLLCAIMAGSGLDTTDMRSIRGVALIDEIGAHLHPRWRMHITRRLRAAFPQVQFLISTHEPLCLRGMRAREVVRVWRTGGDDPAELEVVDRSPSDYRVDQLLTSEFFGLGTTIDPDQQRRWDDYYAALAALEKARQHDPADPSLATLQADVDRFRGLAPTHGILGVTRRDQLAYEVIDRYLAVEEELTPAERRRRRAQAISDAADLYRMTVPGHRGGGAQ